MTSYRNTYALTLRRDDIGDDDRRYTLYARELGKVSAVAVGARKIKSKLAGHLEPFRVFSCVLAQTDRRSTLTAASTVERYRRLPADLARLNAGGRCLRLADELTREAAPDERLFRLLVATLRALERATTSAVVALLPEVFTLKLLALLGYAPQLATCVVCRTAVVPEGNRFAPGLGGLVCGKCTLPPGVDGVVVSSSVIKLLRVSLTLPWSQLIKLRAVGSTAASFSSVVQQFLAYHR